MNKVAQVDAILLEKVKKFIKENYRPEIEDEDLGVPSYAFLLNRPMHFMANQQLTNVVKNTKPTWQQSVFSIIDKKGFTDPEVYKRAFITKQIFSRIRSDENYRPSKDTAIQMCFGLQLNEDEARDLMAKAGYTLSESIERDLVVRYFIREKIYDIDQLNLTLYDLSSELGEDFKLFGIHEKI